MAEMEFEDIQRDLSIKEQVTSAVLSRRLFLQAAAAGVGMSMMPDWLTSTAAWAAPPLGPSDGVLVVIQMGGGNDGLNTVIPTNNGTYYARRGGLAIPQSSALTIANGVGLHPALRKLKARYDAGKVAVVEGVGYTNPDLSHFTSVATWMSGTVQAGPPRSGWLGRYLDGLGTDPFYGVTMGTTIPLHLQGSRTAATALPVRSGGAFATADDAVTRRLADGVRAFGASSTGLGALTDLVAETGRRAMDMGTQVSGCYNPSLPSGNLVPQMTLTARLINANLGVRVFGVSCGSFDTHSGQATDHNTRLAEIDDAIEALFATLSPAFADRVTVMSFSEFGRRVEANGSGGTDHGTASPLFVVGNAVRGGLYGAQPSLTDLDSNGNMKPAVKFHSVYATVLEKWLDGDSNELLGASVEQLPIFKARPSGEVIAQPTPPPPPPAAAPIITPLPTTRPVSFPSSYRLVTGAGSVHSYGGADSRGNASTRSRGVAIAASPSQRGYWIAAADGGVFAFGDAPFHGSMGGQRLNAPIVGMAATPTGNGYWLLGRDGGIFSYGDAAFYGSTGNMRLNQPVVGMAAVPTGGGYWFVAADGGIFSFGPGARFYGSTGDMRLNKPIVGMAPTPTGKGYWLVASDGGIFTFGDAGFYGSTGAIRLNQPIVGMAATPTGRGYRFVASDGGVFTFGDAGFHGGLGNNPPASGVVGIAT